MEEAEYPFFIFFVIYKTYTSISRVRFVLLYIFNNSKYHTTKNYCIIALYFTLVKSNRMPHNHLLINHLPIFATLFGLIFVWIAIIMNNQTLRITALIMLLLGGLSFLPSNFPGDAAHEVVEHLEGFERKSQNRKLMHEHEEMAEFATPFGIAMAILALFALILDARKSKYAQILAGIAGVLAIVVMVLLARVANSGGEIRHPEIRKDFKQPTTEHKH